MADLVTSDGRRIGLYAKKLISTRNNNQKLLKSKS